MSKKSPKPKMVNLALQGGGAHGALAWGIMVADIKSRRNLLPRPNNPMKRFWGAGNGENPLAYFMFDTMARMFSPEQFNPMDINPLRDVLEKVIDFDEIQKCKKLKLFQTQSFKIYSL